jgi:hypothetical protein
MRRTIVLPVLLLFLSYAAAQDLKVSAEDFVKNIPENPDWQKISTEAVEHFGGQNADSIVQVAKMKYYFNHKEYSPYIKEYIRFVKICNLLTDPASKNAVAWHIFEYGTDPEDLREAKNWAVEAIDAESGNGYYRDTYANLLYKTGDVTGAVTWQTSAVWYGQWWRPLVINLFKMRAGLPTWKYPDIVQSPLDEKSKDVIWLTIRQDLKRTADSVIWVSQVSLSQADKDPNRVRLLIQYVEEFKPKRPGVTLNKDSWYVFKNSNNKAELEKALAWSRESLKDQKITANKYLLMDTYANLLHKLGRTKEALETQEKVVSLAPEKQKPQFQDTLDKMKKGLNTWE